MDRKPSILTQKFEIGRLLGQGTFAKVYFARCVTTNHSKAIKVVDKERIIKAGLAEQVKREIYVMRIVKHPNVVQLYEVMATKSKIYFVMEYCKGGELFNKVAKGKLREDVARKYFLQLINAVDFFHSRGVYHRDIKLENLLLDENENLKISDFGLSALAESKHRDGLLHTACGTPAYVAPEVINRKGYDGAKADIWSCGVVLYALLAGYLPFHDSNLIEMYRKIGRADFKCPNWFSQAACRLIFKMLDPNPDTRISIAKIMESSWIRKWLDSKLKEVETESKDVIGLERHCSGPSENNCMPCEAQEEPVKLPQLNAFDIISLSAGFDLSGFFDENPLSREARFISLHPAWVIISKLEDVAKRLELKITKKGAGLLRMEGLDVGRKGALSIDAEIFEVAQNVHLVELRKSNGDSLQYLKVLTEDIQPAVQDVVWVWQGELQQPEAQQ